MSVSNFGIQALLHLAVEHKNIEELRKLVLEQPFNINSQDNPNKLTPLMLACIHPDETSLQMAKILVQSEADINLFDKNNATALCRLSETICKDPSNEIALNLFYYLLCERRPREVALHCAIDILRSLTQEETPYEIKEKALSKQISILFGLDEINLQNDYNNPEIWFQYETHLRNWLEVKLADGSVKEDGQVGNYLDKFLCQRIRIYLKIFIEGITHKWVDLSFDPEMGIRCLKQEILTDLEIYWQEKARQACMSLPEQYREEALQVIAENIVRQCSDLPIGYEYSFYSGYHFSAPAHCLYISLEKVAPDSVIVRVDNRWTQSNRNDGLYHLPMASNTDYVQPHYIGYFRLDNNKLNSYLVGCMQALSDDCDKAAMAKIYPDSTDYNDLPQYAEMRELSLVRWFPQPKQQDRMGNCILSNHNYGIASRLGVNLSEWLLHRELSIVASLSAGQLGPAFPSPNAAITAPTRLFITLPSKTASFSGATMAGIGFFCTRAYLTMQTNSTLLSYAQQIDLQHVLKPGTLIDEAIHQQFHLTLATLSSCRSFAPIIVAGLAAGATAGVVSWWQSRYTIFGSNAADSEERQRPSNDELDQEQNIRQNAL